MNSNKKKLLLVSVGVIVVVAVISLLILFKKPVSLFRILNPNGTSIIEIEIPKNSWSFTPETITLKKDKKYTIHITNRDDYPHGFSVTELNVNQYIPPLTVKTFEMKPTISGEFTSYCSVVCGQGHFKMKGKVKVVD